ncbi:hypothetical protein M2459_001320 [Parabacteroides sp. PF5-5]|uniref:hypothetical protein n=1 Tax=unclassified Parabacteroides TaxID=2649774 RepID=UPI002475A095|nr:MULTISPECIES: hypothetical protein [unclassified Parabacteroides]MDH6304585.1 hypothetical protein [Parabacteroides sp. PH5-39]MDH6315802.1 hypothetical protein [Parabacteroides sp. PF5-13]MDH6319461.1 hypothetical protein [Parabacteroides sp. PH5-13]MDH6323192.1 hypothetical protein [Parabacteroides sp. PH5-8]MDH6326994.1 hypothetical protein [Parabacteroides sp. PH5-41]
MRKLISILLTFTAVLLPLKAFAADEMGAPAKVWTYPVIYALDQEVSWYFDMNGTGFGEGEDLYLWAWSPSEPDAGNWENSSEFAKLDYVGNGVYKKTLTPTAYFGVPVADIESSAGFWMRLKNKSGAGQSDVISAPWSVAEIRGFKESGNLVQIFPEKFYLDEPLSLLINAEKVWTGGVQGGLVDMPSIHLHSGLNNFDGAALVEYQAWVPEMIEKTKFTLIGDNIYKIDFIPREYYGVDEDYVMENIQFVLPGTDWGKVGTDEGGKDFLILAPGVPIPLDPEFYFFPRRISSLDILTLVRTNNEKNSKGLVYTITAGSKTIKGEFTGAKTEMKAHINLLQELSSISNLSKITLKLQHLEGADILTTDIPLIPISELE